MRRPVLVKPPGAVAVKVARLQHSATPFALLPSALLASPGLQGSVPVEVPRKGGCCHLETTISKDQSLARSHPNAAVHCRVVTTMAAELVGKLLGLLSADARLATAGSAKNSSVQLMRLSLTPDGSSCVGAVNLAGDPQSVQEHGEFACDCDDSALLAVLSTALHQLFAVSA